MLPIILGMPALVLLMFGVIGGSILYYTKRDLEFEMTKGMPADIRHKFWYNR